LTLRSSVQVAGPAGTLGPSRLAGFLCLAAAGSSAGLFLWLERGVFLPVARRQALEHVVVMPPLATLAASVTSILILLVAVHLVVRYQAKRRNHEPAPFTIEDVGYLTPLIGLAAGALGLLNLVPGVAAFSSVWSFLIVDLRWWWAVILLACLIWNVDRRVNGENGRMLGALRRLTASRWFVETAIVAAAVVWAVLGTPNLRFSGLTDGDEPKYIRFCEAFYQGLGFEVTNLQLIGELPTGYRSRWQRNFRLLSRTLPGELRSLASDAAAFVAHPTRRFNRARQIDVGFLIGKDGGRYQLYNPGVSILMFPAYYLDRTFGGRQAGPSGQWPAELRAVNTFFLGLYALWTLLIFRFLRRLVEANGPAAVATIAIAFTLPVAAFPFQFYPELAGGVLLFLVAHHLLFADRTSSAVSAIEGLMAGYLPWLHIRFSAIAGVLFVTAMVLHRRDLRRAIWFAVGFAAPLALLCLYAYHLTGSVMPTAMWSAEGSEPVFSGIGAFFTSGAYLLDRDWGLFAHSPVYLFAVPGYFMLARRRRDAAWVSLLVFLALLVPAAGHTLHGAGTTPMRLILAATPLGAAPIAEWLARRSRQPNTHVWFGLLLLLSLDNALAYNLHHFKGFGPLVDWGFSGWRVNLLFPAEGRAPWLVSRPNAALFAAWVVAILGFAVSQSKPDAAPSSTVTWARSVVVVLSLGLAGTIVSAATGAWVRNTYLVPADVAAKRAVERLDQIGSRAACSTSVEGHVSCDSLRADLASFP
jgi:hypothetical protein